MPVTPKGNLIREVSVLTNTKRPTAIFRLTIGILAGSLMAVPITVAATEHSAVSIVNPAVAKPLQAAQQAVRKAHWTIALEKLKQAQAVANKTPQEQYGIDELLAYVLYRQNKLNEAVVIYERLLNSPISNSLSERDISVRIKALAEMYFRLNKYEKAAAWSERYLDNHPDRQDMLGMLGESYFRLKDYRKAVVIMNRAVAVVEHEGKTPKESWLRIIDSSYFQLGDSRNTASTLEQLVRYYGKKDDWKALLDRRLREASDERVLFGYHRLMLDLGILNGADRYEELALEALDAGLPAEARRVIELGMKQGVFENGESLPGRYKRLLEDAKQRATVSHAEVTRFAKEGSSDVNSGDDLKFGRLFLSEGRYAEAIAALKRALRAANAQNKDDARISLGIAYLKTGRKALARQTFNAVGQDSKWRDLATLWTFR